MLLSKIGDYIANKIEDLKPKPFLVEIKSPPIYMGITTIEISNGYTNHKIVGGKNEEDVRRKVEANLKKRSYISYIKPSKDWGLGIIHHEDGRVEIID